MSTNQKSARHGQTPHAEAFFPFRPEDEYFVAHAEKNIIQMLSHPTLTPVQPRSLSRLLYGLKSLPRVTPRLDIQGHAF